jgi:hypothetical protein
MILKLKVQYDDSERKYRPTHIFFINDFVNFYEFKPILTEVGEFVNDNNIESYIRNKNEVYFKIEKTESGYVNFGITRKIEFSEEVLIETMCSATGMTEDEIFVKSRKLMYVIPRAVIYAASMYFGGITSTALMKYGHGHSNILYAVNKSLPSFLIISNKEAMKLVTIVAEKFSGDDFYDYCKTYRSCKPVAGIKPKEYKGVHTHNNKYQAVCQVGGKAKQIGTYETRFAAQQAYNKYVSENQLNQL